MSKPTRIRVGSQEKIVVDGKISIYSLDCENPDGMDSIEIVAPRTAKSKSGASSSADPRNIGIGLIHLKIKALDKLP